MNGSLRVLVVEDEWLVADYIVDVLEEAGHEVVTAEGALRHLERTAVDIAVLDIKLKGSMSGIDVARAARERGIPHVFITGSGDPATRQAAEATGPVGFFQKPFSPAGLMALLAGPIREKAHGN